MRMPSFMLAVAVLLCAQVAIGDVAVQDDPDQAEADPGAAPVAEARLPVEGGYVVCSGVCAPSRQGDSPTTGYVAVFRRRVPRDWPAIVDKYHNYDEMPDQYNYRIFNRLVATEHDCHDAGYGDTNECSMVATERAALEEAERIVAESKIRAWTTSEVFDVNVIRCPHGEKDFDAAEEAVERAIMRRYGLQCIQKIGSLEYVTGANNLIECRGCFAPAIDAAIRDKADAPTTYHLRWKMADNGNAYFRAGFWPETDYATIIAHGIYSPGCEVELFDDCEASYRRGACVLLEFEVTETGTVRNPVVIDAQPQGNRTIPPGVFNRAAIREALKLKYKPKMVDGKPVAVPGVRIKMTFELNE